MSKPFNRKAAEQRRKALAAALDQDPGIRQRINGLHATVNANFERAVRTIEDAIAGVNATVADVMRPLHDDAQKAAKLLSVVDANKDESLPDVERCLIDVLAATGGALTPRQIIFLVFAAQSDDALAAVIARYKNQGAQKAANASHAGRQLMREKAQELFLGATTPWESLAAAATTIAPQILAMNNISRPLAKGNAHRTVSEWLSKFVASDTKAKAKLAKTALDRLRKSSTTR